MGTGTGTYLGTCPIQNTSILEGEGLGLIFLWYLVPLFNYYLSISFPVPTVLLDPDLDPGEPKQRDPCGSGSRWAKTSIAVPQRNLANRDPPVHFDADPGKDPDPNRSLWCRSESTPHQITAICDHWQTDPPIFWASLNLWASTALDGSILSLHSYWILISMWIRILSAFWLWCGSGSGFPKWCRILQIYADPYRTHPQQRSKPWKIHLPLLILQKDLEKSSYKLEMTQL